MGSRISFATHEHETGSFEQARCLPSPLLEGVVLGYTGYVHRGLGRARRREPAQDKVTLILNFGPRLRVGGPGFPSAELDSFIAPVEDSYAVTEEGEALHGLQVDLSPQGAHMVLGVPMRELTELVIDLEAVIGNGARLLVEQLYLAPGWVARFDLLDAFLLGRLDSARPPSPEVAWAWRRLRETDGQLRIGALADELRCSRRHLSARFREQIGPTPKAAARIIRFRRASGLIEAGLGLAEAAQECGYYDQAHFNRDFRELAGTTPGGLLSDLIPDGFGIAA